MSFLEAPAVRLELVLVRRRLERMEQLLVGRQLVVPNEVWLKVLAYQRLAEGSARLSGCRLGRHERSERHLQCQPET